MGVEDLRRASGTRGLEISPLGQVPGRQGLRPAQTCPCLQLRSHLNVKPSSPGTVSKNLGSERALVLAQSGTFTVTNQLFNKV